MDEMEGGSAVQRTVTLTDFSLESLGGSDIREPRILAGQLMQAIRYYLADRDSGQAGWPYPRFRDGDGAGGKGVEMRVEIDDAIWDEFSKEADRQGVSTEKLLQHAALYFAADFDAGRLTQRILDGLN